LEGHFGALMLLFLVPDLLIATFRFVKNGNKKSHKFLELDNEK